MGSCTMIEMQPWCVWTGNPNLCGPIPPGVTVFEYLGGTNVTQVLTHLKALVLNWQLPHNIVVWRAYFTCCTV